VSDSGEQTGRASAAVERDAEVSSQRVSRRARVEAAVARCAATKRHGDTVTREELQAWFSITYPAVGTKRDFDRVDLLFAALKADFDAAMLEEHKMAVESERGGRWRFVLPSEQAGYAAKVARDGFTRALGKAQAVASNVDLAQLSDTERAKLDDTSARLAAIRMFATKSIPRRLPDGSGAK
jgi:hypothetical protein